MLALRETVAKRLGLKTANGRGGTLREIENFRGAVGERIALFEVWEKTDGEIITGQRDKHLDFILAFHLEKTAGAEQRLTLFTAVQFNGKLGRRYFFVVKPVHKLLMPVLVKRLCARLAKSD